jgi:glucokinase
LASRTALFNQIRAAVKAGQKTILTEILGGDLSKLRSGSLRKAIRKGDKFVEKLVLEAARYTGIAVASLINILNPEVVVLGGGIMEALEEEIFPTITKTARECVMPGTGQGVQIVASKLADNAGVMGAAVLAHQTLTGA